MGEYQHNTMCDGRVRQGTMPLREKYFTEQTMPCYNKSKNREDVAR